MNYKYMLLLAMLVNAFMLSAAGDKQKQPVTSEQVAVKLVNNEKHHDVARRSLMQGNKNRDLIKLSKKYAITSQLTDLLKEGIDINFKDETGNTALMYATEKCEHEHDNNQTKILDLLLDAKADPTIANLSGTTPLKQALYNNKRAYIIQKLIMAGADPNTESQNNKVVFTNRQNSALITAASSEDGGLLLKWLLAEFDVSKTQDEALRRVYNAFHAELLIKAKANVNAACPTTGDTPLLRAVQKCKFDCSDRCQHSTELIKYLIAQGADVNKVNNDKQTPLMLLKSDNLQFKKNQKCFDDKVKLLLAAGAKDTTQNSCCVIL